MAAWRILARSVVALAVLASLLATHGSNPAQAAPGDQLASFDAAVTAGIPQCPSGIGVGVAFDGDSLILSCAFGNKLWLVDSVTRTSNGTKTIAGVTSLGAIAYDAGRDRLWACDGAFSGTNRVVLIDLNTQALDPTHTPFVVSQCPDGLAYDGSDDTIWTSPDASSPVSHWTTTGTFLGTFSGYLGGCGNSGIAVGGSKLYMANNGCSQIYEVSKDFSSATFFASFPTRLEDLECDNITFAPKYAIWVQDAYDRILNAYEIPEGSCVFGGGGDAASEGYNYRVNLSALGADTGKAGRVSARSGDDADSAIIDESVPDVLDVSVGRSTASADKSDDRKTTSARGTSSVAELSLLGGAITVDAVNAVADVSYNGDTNSGATSSAGSGFVNLTINSVPISDSVPANTTIPIPGVGAVVLREEISSTTAEVANLQVNMIHFTSDDGTVEVVVSSAYATAGRAAQAPLPADPVLPPVPEVPELPTLPGIPGSSEREGFEAGPGGYTVDGTAGWEFGAPTSGPGAANGGENVAATVLAGNYGNGVRGSLRAPAIDLTNYNPDDPLNLNHNQDAILRFASWFQSEYWYDCGFVRASTDDGATWTVVTPREGYSYPSSAYCGGFYPSQSFSGWSNANNWAEYSVELSSFAGQRVLIDFAFGSDGSVVGAGWYLDDVGLVFEDRPE